MQQNDGNIIIGKPLSAERARINFLSKSCTFKIGSNSVIDDLEVNFNNAGQSLIIGNNCKIRGVLHLNNWDNHIVFGAGTICNSMIWMSVSENSCRIDIGEMCLLSNVKFRTSDSHRIFDLETGQRINSGKSIIVHHRVWIAEDVFIYKGVKIGSDSVIAGRSLVVSDIPPNSLAGGSPAKVLRRGIRWEP